MTAVDQSWRTTPKLLPLEPREVPAVIGYAVGADHALARVDVQTGAVAAVGPTGFTALEALAADPAGRLFGVDAATDQLVRLDPATGRGAAVGPLGVDVTHAGLTFDDAGHLFLSADGTLFQANTGTGAATAVGGFGRPVGELAFRDGTLFGLAGTTLVSVNPATGATTDIGTASAAVGLDFDPNGELLYALDSAGTLSVVEPDHGLAFSVALTQPGFTALAIPADVPPVVEPAPAPEPVPDPVPPVVTPDPTPPVPQLPPPVVVGAGQGGEPRVRVLNADGCERTSFLAYDAGFRGGVNVALADITGDGTPDVVTAAGSGGGPHVKVFDGASGQEVRSFFAYADFFRGGVSVAAADLNADGFAEVVTGAGPGGGPHVKVFDGRTTAETASFFAYSETFGGGVSVTAGDLGGDGTPDLITGALTGGSQVKVFDAGGRTERQSLFAYDESFAGGVNVAASDSELITAPHAGAAPVRSFALPDATPHDLFDAFDPTFLGGVSVA